MRLIIFIGFCFFFGVWGQDETVTNPSVEIQQGTVIGTLDHGVYEFHGIPYADSTSGIHRFKAPLPAPTFEAPFVANRKGIKCIRALGVGYEGVEDCLVADVYTTTLDSTRRLPVMVWIKGREFDRVYEHELSFKNFLEQDVIIVSLNFRESIFGFLCLGTEVAPGNAGLKDIIAGLHWVQENIENFGGDPDSVTLFGHGSGAAAVDLVSLSPMSEGLIHRVIAQSGSAIAPWAVTRDNLEYAIQVAEALGHTVSDINTLSEVFTKTSVAALTAVINELELFDNSLAFAPCVEKQTLVSSIPFMTTSPYQVLNDGEFLQIPIMTGYVDKEGTIRAEEAIEDNWLEKMDESFEAFLQPDLEFENEEDENRIADNIKQYYFGSDGIDMDEYFMYHGDTMIKVSAIREAQLRAASSTSPVYLYQFSYKGTLGDPFVGPVEVDGAAHSEELAYLFHETTEQESSQIDLTVSDILIERWTNFAKTGNPTSLTSQVTWNPFTSENNNFLHILNDDSQQSSTFEVEMQNPHAVTVAFWNSIYQGHFKDAEGLFDLNERQEDDVIVVDSNENTEDGEENPEGSGENPEGSDEYTEGSNENTDSNEDIDAVDTDDNDDGEPDSASTAVAYTFSFIAAFALLNQFHITRISS
ncbi:venom carboxylesterase-6-like [Cydia splendana]|uniref:venom carboxylesterase-6-like n=1 Tax=Cydia splendana TaxID=1100963 RepID=UPI0028F49869